MTYLSFGSKIDQEFEVQVLHFITLVKERILCMKAKRVICGILLVILCFSLSACGNSNPTEAPTKENNPTVDTTNDTSNKAEVTDTDVTEEEKDNTTPVKVGSNINVKGNHSFTIKSFEVVKNYDFKYSKGSFTLKSNLKPKTSSMVLVCITGKLKNLRSKEDYASTCIYGVATIDGNEYEMKVACYEDAQYLASIAPQQTVPCYFYAEVPKDVAKSIKECDIKFGFPEDNAYTNSFDELSEVFELKAKPKNKL